MGKARDLARVIVDSGGLISANNLGNAVPADGSITNAKIASMAASKLTGQVPDANAPSGSVIQVVSTFKNDVFSASLAGGSFTDVPGFSATITPISATSKILVLTSYTLATGGAAMSSRLLRNGTLISNGIATGARVSASSAAVSHTADSNRGVPTSINFLDSPATTSAVTYKLQIGAVEPGGTHTCFFNASGVDNDAGYNARPASSITLLEIAA